MSLKTPDAITHCHKILFSDLDVILDNYQDIKEPIQNLRKIMSEHFQKEEKYALSPLGLLLDLSEGNWQLDGSLQSNILAMAFAIAAEIEKDDLLLCLQGA